MVPYLSLPQGKKEEIDLVLNTYCKTRTTFLSARSALEELGSDRDRIDSLIQKLEARGEISPGLMKVLDRLLAGELVAEDLDRIPRRADYL